MEIIDIQSLVTRIVTLEGNTTKSLVIATHLLRDVETPSPIVARITLPSLITLELI